MLITGSLTVKGSVEFQECGILQSVITSGQAYINAGVNVIPTDDTIPQNTEGYEVLTCTITPKRADSVLEIEYSAPTSGLTDNISVVSCLYRDTTANCLRCVVTPTNATAATIYTLPVVTLLRHWVDASSTSATTFKIRIGKQTGGASQAGIGKNLYGDTLTYYLRVTEYLNASNNFNV